MFLNGIHKKKAKFLKISVKRPHWIIEQTPTWNPRWCIICLLLRLLKVEDKGRRMLLDVFVSRQRFYGESRWTLFDGFDAPKGLLTNIKKNHYFSRSTNTFWGCLVLFGHYTLVFRFSLFIVPLSNLHVPRRRLLQRKVFHLRCKKSYACKQAWYSPTVSKIQPRRW